MNKLHESFSFRKKISLFTAHGHVMNLLTHTKFHFECEHKGSCKCCFWKYKFIVRWPDQGTPQNFGETILLHFLIDMMVLIKNQEGVEL